MENSIFNRINELNSPEYIFNKFSGDDDNQSYLTLEQCKQSLFFIFGKKIKKKKIREILLSKCNIDHSTISFSEGINLNLFRILTNSIKNHRELHLIDDFDLILNFYDFLRKDNKELKTLNFLLFENKFIQKFPLIKSSYIQEIFLELDYDNDGVIKLSDLEKYLIKMKYN